MGPRSIPKYLMFFLLVPKEAYKALYYLSSGKKCELW